MTEETVGRIIVPEFWLAVVLPLKFVATTVTPIAESMSAITVVYVAEVAPEIFVLPRFH